MKSWNDAKESSTGFFIGPMAEITLPVIGLGIDGALLFSQRGKDEAKQQGLEIPVNLKYTSGLGSMFGIYLAAGPDFFFNFKDIDLANVEAKKTHPDLRTAPSPPSSEGATAFLSHFMLHPAYFR